MSLDIESADVIRLIQQFLREQQLLDSLQALEKETGLETLGTDQGHLLEEQIEKGQWDKVLPVLTVYPLSDSFRFSLYEQVVKELIEMQEIEAARIVLRQSVIMDRMKQKQADRFLHLEKLLARQTFQAAEAYAQGSRERERHRLAQQMKKELQVVPASRLLTLLGQSLKWMHNQHMLPPDMSYDLYRGQSTARTDAAEDGIPSTAFAIMKFGKKSCPEAAAFANDGSFLVTGTIDGFVEIWDPMKGQLRKDLTYQAQDQIMMVKGAALAVAVSHNNQLIAVGTDQGQVKVFEVASGKCQVVFEKAHAQGITSLVFLPEDSQILTSSFDGTARVLGLKSGRVVREYRGHQSYVNHAIYSADGSRIITASSDGTVKIWKAKTAELLHTIDPDPNRATITVSQVRLLPHCPDTLFVCNQSPQLHVFSVATGERQATLSTDATVADKDFRFMCVTPHGEWVLAVSEDGCLHAFHTETMSYGSSVQLHAPPTEVVGIAHHPLKPYMVSFADDGLLSWLNTFGDLDRDSH